MPIYEYHCITCDQRFERLTSGAERLEVTCPRCRGGKVERLLSTFAVGKSSATLTPPGPCGSSDCACRTSDT